MEESLLLQIVEDLRSQLVQLVKEKGCFLDCKVIEKSQELDRFLVQLQRIHLCNRQNALY